MPHVVRIHFGVVCAFKNVKTVSGFAYGCWNKQKSDWGGPQVLVTTCTVHYTFLRGANSVHIYTPSTAITRSETPVKVMNTHRLSKSHITRIVSGGKCPTGCRRPSKKRILHNILIYMVQCASKCVLMHSRL